MGDSIALGVWVLAALVALRLLRWVWVQRRNYRKGLG